MGNDSTKQIQSFYLRKIIAFKSLFILAMVFGLGITAASAATTTLEIIPQSETVFQGDVFTVNLKITPGQSITAMQAGLSYDSDLLSDTITDGKLFANFDKPAGQIVGYQGIDDSAITESGNLAVIQFTAIKEGVTTLGLSDVKLADINGLAVPAEDVEIIGGKVTVIKEGDGKMNVATENKIIKKDDSASSTTSSKLPVPVYMSFLAILLAFAFAVRSNQKRL